VLNEGVSRERLLTIRSFGGEIVAVPKSAGIAGAIAEAARIARERGCFYARQFENPDNAEAHRVWTGQEILAQLDGRCIDAVVSGVGTGGTIVGLYRAFEEAGCRAVPFVARPVTGAATRDVECSSFSSRVPGVVECASTIYREANLPGAVELDVDDDLALETTRRLHARGFPVGPSSGLNYAAAVAAARRLGPESTVVTVFPDRMERYFSTELFSHAAENV
jgi:cysteine synthase A